MAEISKKVGDSAQSEVNSLSRNKEKRYFSTLNLVVIAFLAALGNIISASLDNFKLFFPAGTIPYFQFFSGYHLIWMALAFGITRKHGAPTFVAAIKGIFEFMSWDAFFGPWVILLNLVEGAMLDLGFYAFRRLNSERGRWIIAGCLGNLFQPLISSSIGFYYIGRLFPEITILLLATVFSVVSGALIAGLVGYQLQKVLRRQDVQAYMASG
jgi:ABC-type thiamin/hydroxymethylpyrimidine transport system permease subunit